RTATRERTDQAADPRALSERGRVRSADLRSRGGRAKILREAGDRALADGVLHAGRHDSLTADLRPHSPPETRREARALDPALDVAQSRRLPLLYRKKSPTAAANMSSAVVETTTRLAFELGWPAISFRSEATRTMPTSRKGARTPFRI